MRRWRSIVWVGLVWTAMMWTGGCDRSSQAEEQFALRSEIWPEDPQRIVSLAPTATELLFELGVGEHVVGVTRYCDWPPEAEEIATIGGGLGPDLEALLAAEPDLVVGVIAGLDEELAERLDGASISWGFVAMDDRATVEASIHQLGRWLGREGRADEIVARLTAGLDAESSRAQDALGGEATTALMVFDREPAVAAGPGTYADELLSLMGLENVLSRGARDYPVLDVEQILALNPDVIIDVDVAGDSEQVLSYWGRFSSLKAVSNRRVVVVTDPVVTRPGVRMDQGLRALRLHLEGTAREP